MPTIACKTLGCKVNQYDTEAMLELFEQSGYTAVPFEENADVYIINTCTVTGTGDSKSVKLIHRVNREHPQSHIIVAGCLTQRAPERVLLPGVVLALGVTQRSEVVSLYKKAISENAAINATQPLNDASFEHLTVSRHEGKTRATMKIQEGCDRYCSYCVIPYVRGPIRSMPLDDVKIEAQRLAEAGYREIVLTGIHLASYGRNTDFTLLDAVYAVATTSGVKRVRLGSLEPKGITEEFARRLSLIPGICPQFHLSLQSGSDTVLKRMNRRYTTGEYLDACANLRKFMPDCAITTDIIVGFPGETEAEFCESMAFAEKAALARVHVFPYSRRSGTVADRMPGQISEEIKKQRAARLIEKCSRLEENYVSSKPGTCQKVLFETEIQPGLCEGYTDTYVRVRAKAIPGQIANVYITRAEGTLCEGEIVK